MPRRVADRTATRVRGETDTPSGFGRSTRPERRAGLAVESHSPAGPGDIGGERVGYH